MTWLAMQGIPGLVSVCVCVCVCVKYFVNFCIIATVFNNANQHINVYGDDIEVDYRGYEVLYPLHCCFY